MARKKAAKEASNGSVVAARATLSGRAALEALALELYGVIGAALRKYGLSPAEQKRLFAQSQRKSSIKPAAPPTERAAWLQFGGVHAQRWEGNIHRSFPVSTMRNPWVSATSCPRW